MSPQGEGTLMTTLLEVADLEVHFAVGAKGLGQPRGMLRAVDGVSLKVAAGETLGIVGESGCGKTTLGRAILRLLTPTAGSIHFDGQDITRANQRELAPVRKAMQAIFQDPFEVYNPFYKVDHILETPIAKFGLASSPAQARQLMAEALQAVGLRPEETLGRYPHQLSGGQRQRITIARALLLKPRLIIADEPVSMVDASLRATILESLHRLHRDFGISFLYITHDLTTAYQVSQRIVVLYHGTVVEAGEVEQVIRHPKHPYTQELIRSIPVPDPGQGWIDEPVAEKAEAEESQVTTGCRYAPRCPHAMPRCLQAMPPLFRTEPNRAAACYLYDSAPPLAGEDLSEVLEQSH